MRFPNYRHPLVVLVGVLALLLVAPLGSSAEEDAGTLSGRVVDMTGHPVSDLALGIQPIDMIEGEMWQMPTPMQQSRTDAAGNFRINDIVPGHAKLVVVPKTGTFESDKEIHAIEIGGLRFLPIDHPNFQISHEQRIRFLSTFEVEPKKVSAVGGIPLYIKSGVDIKDITVTVRPRMRVRCRVLLADGTPLTDAAVKLHLNYRSLDGVNSGRGSRSPTYTDSDGYIVMYMNLPAFCTVSIEYQGDTAMGETFKIGEEQRRHDLVFRLSKASMPPVPNAPTPLSDDVQVPPIPRIPKEVQAPPVPRIPKEVQAPPVPQMPNLIGAWVVNPANGHAYKKIRCRSWEDARAKAIDEGAHLVSINDEAEQKWLVEVFGREPFLIGLTRLENQTEWQWTSGEPIAYTNWALRGLTTVQEAFVFVSMIDGKWRIGTSESLQRVGIVLLEKEVDRLEAK
ncbi:hypothetical protein C6500_18655 [Candidatus Poribacteria bacterium]|nr:MAG: hypothetical protein C6500_18655 [Candidatus Poribacteria bacterium]